MPENEDRKIGDLMVPLSEYPYVYDDDTLREAIDVLKGHRLGQDRLHRSVLVFSRTEKVQGEERLVGILTIRDVLNALEKNRFILKNQIILSTGWVNFYRKNLLGEVLTVRVNSAIRPLVKAYTQAEDPVAKAIEVMMTRKVNIVPVFSNKKAVGIIRALDILDYISERFLSNDHLSEGQPKKGKRHPAERESLWPGYSSPAMPLLGV